MCFVVLLLSTGWARLHGLAVYLNCSVGARLGGRLNIARDDAVLLRRRVHPAWSSRRSIARHDARIAGGRRRCRRRSRRWPCSARWASSWQLFVVYAVFAMGSAPPAWCPLRRSSRVPVFTCGAGGASVASTGLSVGGILFTLFAKLAPRLSVALASRHRMARGHLVPRHRPITVASLRPDPAALGWLPDGASCSTVSPRPPSTARCSTRRCERGSSAVTFGGNALVLGSQEAPSSSSSSHGGAHRPWCQNARDDVPRRHVRRRVARRWSGGDACRAAADRRAVLSVVQVMALASIAGARGEGRAARRDRAVRGDDRAFSTLQPLLVAERFGVRRLSEDLQPLPVRHTTSAPRPPVAARSAPRCRRRLPHFLPRGCGLLGQRRRGPHDGWPGPGARARDRHRGGPVSAPTQRRASRPGGARTRPSTSRQLPFPTARRRRPTPPAAIGVEVGARL